MNPILVAGKINNTETDSKFNNNVSVQHSWLKPNNVSVQHSWLKPNNVSVQHSWLKPNNVSVQHSWLKPNYVSVQHSWLKPNNEIYLIIIYQDILRISSKHLSLQFVDDNNTLMDILTKSQWKNNKYYIYKHSFSITYIYKFAIIS